MGRDNEVSQHRNSSSSSSARPAVLRDIRNSALNTLHNWLTQCLAETGDALLSRSADARSNTEQTRYFEARQEVHTREQEFIDRYRHQIEQSFDVHASPADRDAIARRFDPDSLNLVEQDELEQNLALSTMAGKARAGNQEALYQLQCRVEALRPGQTEQPKPLDPEALCAALQVAAAPLELDIRARIVLFKQFDREVLARLPELYRNLNRQLIEAGILPEIKSTQARGSPPPAEPDSQANACGLAELTGLLQGLQPSTRRPTAFVPRYSSRPGAVIARNELIQRAEALQASFSYGDFAQQTIDIGDAVERIMATAESKSSPDQALASPDEDIINLVALFFDFALADPALPAKFQSLISRLQLPILRLALLDPAFFNTTGHPARLLINDIARLGVGFDDASSPRHDSVTRAVEDIIRTIHEQPHGDAALYASLRDQLQQVVVREQSKAERVEHRTRANALGRARTRAARATVLLELQQRLKQAELPAAIRKFLIDDWQAVLLLTCLKQGEDSADWLEALQVVDDLVWSARNHEDDKSKARRARLLPGVRERIRKGLLKSVATEAELAEKIEALDHICELLQHGRAEDMHYGYDEQHRDDDSALDEVATGKSWKDMTAAERHEAEQERITYEHLRQVDAVAPGTWMIFADPLSGESRRCKMSARLEQTDSLLFVDRFGFKVMERKRRDVAQDIQHERVTIIDGSPLFEKTLGTMVDSLTTLGQATAG